MTATTVTYDFLSPPHPAAKLNASAAIHAALRKAIVQLDLKPGEVIDKQAIAMRFGVSRFPVGEAMNRLAAEGLVDIMPQSGTRVALIRLSDARECMFLRRAIESETCRQVAITATPRLVENLTRSLAYQAAAIAAHDVNGFHSFDLAFHDLLQDHLDFARVRKATDSARLGLDRIRRLLNTRQRLAITLDEHRAIRNAIAARDGEAAARAMNRHLDEVLAELERFAEDRPELFADLAPHGGSNR